MPQFPNSPSRRAPRHGFRGPFAACCVKWALAFLAAFVLLGPARLCAAQPLPESDAVVQPTPEKAASTVEETLRRLDGLLAQFDARIKGIRGRAEGLLEQADAAKNPDEQMRFEELYGRMMNTARDMEAQRSRLRLMRDELAISVQRTAP